MAFIWKHWDLSKSTRRSRVGLAVACLAFSIQAPAFSSAYFDLQTEWTKTFNDGVTALDSNLYGKAEPLLKEAVSLSERFGAGDPRGPKSLGELGRLYTIRRRYSEAEPLLEQQLHLTEVQLGKNSGKTVPALGTLIKFYLMYGTSSKSEPLAEELLAFIDGKMREDANANAEKAQGGKRVLTAWAGTAAPGEHIPRIEWAVTCDRLGDVYRLKKKYAMAERFYKAGLDIKVTVIGKQHMSMAVSYDNLGILAMDKEEYADAAEYFRQSLETTQKIMGAGDPDTYARLDRLARALIKDKKYAEAERTYNLALKLWHDEPNTGGATARCLYQLGSMYAEQGRFGQAASTLGRALNLSIRASGPLSYTNVAYLRKYAYALYYCGRRGESESLKSRANWLAAGMDESVAKPVVKTAQDDKTKAPGDKTASDKTAGERPAIVKYDKNGKAMPIDKTAKNEKDAKTDKTGKGDKLAKNGKPEPAKPSMTDEAMKVWEQEVALHQAQDAKENAEKAARDAALNAAKPVMVEKSAGGETSVSEAPAIDGTATVGGATGSVNPATSAPVEKSEHSVFAPVSERPAFVPAAKTEQPSVTESSPVIGQPPVTEQNTPSKAPVAGAGASP